MAVVAASGAVTGDSDEGEDDDDDVNDGGGGGIRGSDGNGGCGGCITAMSDGDRMTMKTTTMTALVAEAKATTSWQ